MMRRILALGCLLALVAGVAAAGDMMKKDTGMKAGSDKMEMAMAEMAKCDVCKHMLPYMPELGASLTMDMARLNDGVALIHGVSDPALVDQYRAMSAELDDAGEACLMLTDQEAKTHLCPMCQSIRSAVNAGAKMSTGPTKMGDVMVLTSDDPTVQKQLQSLGDKCEMMMSSM